MHAATVIPAEPAQSTPRVLSRIAAALLGGYAFCWGFVVFGIAAQVAAGRDFDEAWMLVMLLVFLVYLAVFIWAFAARHLARVWIVLLGGGAVMTFAASLLAARVAGGG